MPKLIVIDGNSLMYRAFYALPAMTSRGGTPTGAIYGFLSMLLKLAAGNPEYMLVAFDMHGPTIRHESYAEYKSNRKPMPDELREQMPIIKRILTDMGIAVCECPGYEADDLLGTFARIANSGGIDALLVTGDRDALQLISDSTHVLMTKKGISETIEFDAETLYEQYGVTPAQIVDLKGLMGDASDNIPGIPGVGEKTAVKLIKKYGGLEESLKHADDEKGALRQKLMDNANHLYDGLQKLGYELSSHISPVVPVIIGSKEEGLRIWRELISLGVYVNLILPPAAPADITLLRCSVNAAHSREQIDAIIQAFATLKQ